MREHPILFNGAMVRALLDGTKTQTRRIVKPKFAPNAVPAEMCAETAEGWQTTGHSGVWWCDAGGCADDAIRCRYGIPGDRLWVRETWRSIPTLCLNDGKSSTRIEYAAGRKVLPLGGEPAVWDVPERDSQNWKPSIHMPRAASRITLEVTGVRVERLQDYSELDAVCEGLMRFGAGWRGAEHLKWKISPVAAYRELWQSINCPGSWDANPWVWVVEFRRIAQVRKVA